jgi:hypothetical protein
MIKAMTITMRGLYEITEIKSRCIPPKLLSYNDANIV